MDHCKTGMYCIYDLRRLPHLKLAVDEVIAGAGQLKCSICHSFLNERVGLEVVKGHVDGLLQIFKSPKRNSENRLWKDAGRRI
jgi:hypothetical protein